MNSILWNGKVRVENQTKSRVWEDSSLCPEISTNNTVLESQLGTKKIEEEYMTCPLFLLYTLRGWPL
jgi:hypothetical protein